MKEIKTLFLLNKNFIIFWSYFMFQGRGGGSSGNVSFTPIWDSKMLLGGRLCFRGSAYGESPLSPPLAHLWKSIDLLALFYLLAPTECVHSRVDHQPPGSQQVP